PTDERKEKREEKVREWILPGTVRRVRMTMPRRPPAFLYFSFFHSGAFHGVKAAFFGPAIGAGWPPTQRDAAVRRRWPDPRPRPRPPQRTQKICCTYHIYKDIVTI